MTIGLAVWLIAAAITAAAWPATIRNAQTNQQYPEDRTAIAEMHHSWQSRAGRAATLIAIGLVWPVFAWLITKEAIKHTIRSNP